MSWSQRSQYLYVNDQAPVGLQYNQTTGIWETIFLDENQNKFASLADIFNNPVAPLPVPTTGTDLTLSGFLSAGARVQAGTHFRAPNDQTATTPVYGFTGATDKGMYPTANGLGFAVGGTRIGEVQSWGGGFTGNVIQVVYNQTNTQVITSSSTPQTTGNFLNITPKYNNSKILILYSQGGNYSGSGAGMQFRLRKNASDISQTLEDLHNYAFSSDVGNKYFSQYLDSPGTTSSITYTVFFNSRNGTTNVYTQYNGSYSSIIALEIQQ